MGNQISRTFRAKKMRCTIALVVALLALSSKPAEARPPLNESALVGTWVNVKSTSGLVKIVITGSNGSLTVHPYGACSPTPCDWGSHAAFPFSTSVASSNAMGFNVTILFTFETVRLQGHLVVTSTGQHLIEVTSQTQFTARGDTRFNYERTEDFKRQ
jgi:hypothetical protein